MASSEVQTFVLLVDCRVQFQKVALKTHLCFILTLFLMQTFCQNVKKLIIINIIFIIYNNYEFSCFPKILLIRFQHLKINWFMLFNCDCATLILDLRILTLVRLIVCEGWDVDENREEKKYTRWSLFIHLRVLSFTTTLPSIVSVISIKNTCF